MILTDEEKKALYDQSDLQPYYWLDGKEFADMIEYAVLAKLTGQTGEPVGYVDYGDRVEWYNKPVPETDLFTSSQLLAAQQRTAEACAKVCEAERSEDGDGQTPAWYAGFDACADAIRNGKWREYL